MTEQNKKRKVPKAIIVIAAWLTIVILAVASILLAILLSSVFLSNYSEDTIGLRYVILFGFFGLQVLIFMIFGLWRYRKKIYVQQFLIGLFIGAVIYGFFFAGGTIIYVAHNSSESKVVGECSSPLEQYQSYGSAIVPIATDKGIGSGVIIDDKGTVLTAYHVVEGAEETYANYSAGRVNLTVLNTSEQYDLALLRLEKFDTAYFSLATNYATGDEVLAYGYPYNALTAGSPSITRGVISRVLTIADLRMTQSDLPDGLEYIQTDAAINAGNSGGALIGSCGLVGIVVSVSDSAQVSEYVGAVSEQGIAFAVSAKTAAQAFSLPIKHH